MAQAVFQVGDLSLILPNPYKDECQGWAVEAGGCVEVTTSQCSLIGEPQASERSASREVDGIPGDGTQSWAFTCMFTHVHT